MEYFEGLPVAGESTPQVVFPEKYEGFTQKTSFIAQPPPQVAIEVRETPSKTTRPRKLSDLFHEFAGSTTAHGIPRIIESSYCIAKFFWFIIVVICFTVFILQALNIFASYYTYNTNIELETAKVVPFPAVTICNLNRMKRSKMVNTRFEGIVNIDGGFSGEDGEGTYSWFFDFSSNFDWWDYSSYGGGWSSYSSSYGPGGASSSNSYVAGRKKRDVQELGESQRRGMGRPRPVKKQDNDQRQVRAPRNRRELMAKIRDKRSAWYSSSYYGSYYASSYYYYPTYNNYYYYYDPWWLQEDYYDGGFNEPFIFEYYNYYDWDGITDENDWDGFYAQSTSEDYSDIIDVANPTSDELVLYGHEAEDFILQCTFDKRTCNYTDFTVFQNQLYGNCFTFNGIQKGDDMSQLRNSTKAGNQYGLHLTLFIEQPEYIGLFAHESGVRVVVHPPDVAPSPEDLGISCSTGVSTSVGMRQTEIIRLGGKYGNCTDGTDGVDYLQSSNFSYTVFACSRKCLYSTMAERCGCVTDILAEIDAEKCSFINTTQQRCRRLVESLYNENLLGCNCPPPCREVSYSTTTSTTLWPSDRYESHLYSRVANKNAVAARILQDIEATRKNLARIKVYFEELNYQLIQQVPAHTKQDETALSLPRCKSCHEEQKHLDMKMSKIESISGSVGGLLGLYVGISAITLTEMIIFVIQVYCFILRKMCCKNSISPVEVVT